MKERFKLALQDKIIRYSLLCSLAIFSLASILIMILQTKLPPLIPFLNSMPWGEDRLLGSLAVLVFPVGFFIVILINFFLSIFFYREQPLVARIMSFNALLVLFLGLLAYLQIVFLVL